MDQKKGQGLVYRGEFEGRSRLQDPLRKELQLAVHKFRSERVPSIQVSRVFRLLRKEGLVKVGLLAFPLVDRLLIPTPLAWLLSYRGTFELAVGA